MTSLLCALILLFNSQNPPSFCQDISSATKDINPNVQIDFLQSNQQLKEVHVLKNDQEVSIAPITSSPAKKIKTKYNEQKDKVVIENIHPHVDVEFIKNEKGVKENIIIHRPQDQHEFLFQLGTTQDLSLRKDYHGQWVFYQQDPDNVLFVIPPPFMIDSNESRSDNVQIDLVYKQKMAYLKVAIDKDWVAHPSRVYPITVDPSIEEPEKQSLIEDVSQRTLNSKTLEYSQEKGKYHYINSLGTIHVQDETGKLREKDYVIRPLSHDAEFFYQVKFNDVTISFKDTLDPQGYVKYQKGGDYLVQGINPDQKGLGKMNTPSAVVENNTLIYPDIYPGIDLKYIINDAGLLEEFVVKDKSVVDKISQFDQFFQGSDFEITDNHDGSYLLNQIIIPKPVLYEIYQRSIENYGIHFNVAKHDNSIRFIKVINDSGIAWMKDDARQYPIAIDAALEEHIGASTDDDSNSHAINANDMNCFGKGGNHPGTTPEKCGMRFTGVQIPNGYDISNSKIWVASSSNTSANVGTTIYGEDLDDCATFADSSGATVASRTTYTSANTQWNLGTTGWVSDTTYPSPAVDTIVEEIISRAGWSGSSSSDMCFLWTGTSPTAYTNRMIRQYDYGPGWREAELRLDYAPPVPTNVVATDGTHADKVAVTWTAVSGASSYKVYYSTSAGGAKSYLGNPATNSYDDSSAPAPSVTAPGSLTASAGTYSNQIRVTIGSAGSSTNGTTRYYWVTSIFGTDESDYSTSDTGYRSYGSVTGYDFFYSGDAYASALATNQSSPWDDTSAPSPSPSTPSLTASNGTSASQVTLDVSGASISNGTSRTYKAKTRTSSGTLSVLSTASNAGYTSDSISNYNYQFTDTSSGTNYSIGSTGTTDPYNWTDCTLGIHYWFRTSFNTTGGQTSPWSHSSGGDEGWCDTTSSPLLQFDGVGLDGVNIGGT